MSNDWLKYQQDLVFAAFVMGVTVAELWASMVVHQKPAPVIRLVSVNDRRV